MRRRDALFWLSRAALAGAFAGETALAQDAPAPIAPGAPVAPTPSDLLGASGEAYFTDWLNAFYARALAAGVPQGLIEQALSGLSPDPRVAAHDTAQPEFARPVSAYVEAQITPARIAQGVTRRDAISQFPAIEDRFGVPRDILVGVWALESEFGRLQGDLDIFRSLSTLAALGRRRPWAESELLASFQVLQSGKAPGTHLVGSWAGAMGQTQLLPSVYLADGVDADGDGKCDIWGSAPDALASAANLLAKAGWRRGEGWARQVTLPAGFDYGLAEGPAEAPYAWAERGVTPIDGRPWTGADGAAEAVLLLPCGAQGPAFLAFPNHFVIRRYNNSLAYALTVGLLADGFFAGAPPQIPWPHETPLSLDDRLAAQSSLKTLGYDPGNIDGIIGTRARGALRAWQKANHLPSDAYFSPQIIARLKAEAAASACAPAGPSESGNCPATPGAFTHP